MRTLIGSQAIRHWFPDFPRKPVDTDFAWDEGGIDIQREAWGKYEYYPIPPIAKLGQSTLDADGIYTLKFSHIFWDIQWEKTMWDIVWLQKKGCQLNIPLFKELYQHWCDVHGEPTRADLNMSVGDFFTNGIKDGHKHDTLHTFVAKVNCKPTYTYILKEPTGVDIDQFKFFNLPLNMQLDIIREECYVMAYERMGFMDYRDAYRKQLKAWIITHAPSMEMACIAVWNYDTLRKPLINYKKEIEYGLQRNNY